MSTGTPNRLLSVAVPGLAVATSSLVAPCAPVHAGSTTIYWSDVTQDWIRRVGADGLSNEGVVGTWDQPEDIAIDAVHEKVYWISSGSTGRIQRANLDGSGLETVVSAALVFPTGIALDPEGGHLYWSDYGTDAIHRSSLDGSDRITLIAGLESPDGIALDLEHDHIYWTDSGASKIQRADLDGSDVIDLYAGWEVVGTVEGLALDIDHGRIYWTVQHPFHAIYRGPLGGDAIPEAVVSGLDYPRNLALDLLEEKIYWTESGADRIGKSNLDGTEVELVTDELVVNPTGIALVTLDDAGTVGDVDGDGDVDAGDLLALLAAWGACAGCDADLDGDGDVDTGDLLLLLANWS